MMGRAAAVEKYGEEGMRVIGYSLLASTTSTLGSLKCDAFLLPSEASVVDFSSKVTDKFITAGAAVLLAGVLSRNTSVTSLNLSHNAICGVKYGEGEYDPSGAAALAQALMGNATLTTLDLYDNNLGVEGGQALAGALEVNSTLVSLSLAGVGGFTCT